MRTRTAAFSCVILTVAFAGAFAQDNSKRPSPAASTRASFPTAKPSLLITPAHARKDERFLAGWFHTEKSGAPGQMKLQHF